MLLLLLRNQMVNAYISLVFNFPEEFLVQRANMLFLRKGKNQSFHWQNVCWMRNAYTLFTGNCSYCNSHCPQLKCGILFPELLRIAVDGKKCFQRSACASLRWLHKASLHFVLGKGDFYSCSYCLAIKMTLFF